MNVNVNVKPSDQLVLPVVDLSKKKKVLLVVVVAV